MAVRESIPADEVENILAERVAAEVARQIASIQLKAPTTGEDRSWMESLAMMLGSARDKEIGIAVVSPEEAQKRARAFTKMEELIAKTFESGVQPTYQVNKMIFFGNQVIEPIEIDRATRVATPKEIGWYSIPNQYMTPLNAPAKAIFALFLEWIGDAAKTVSDMRVTPGGLTVRSGGMPVGGGTDLAPSVGRDIYAPIVTSRGGARTSIRTNILGTLLPAAEQMV